MIQEVILLQKERKRKRKMTPVHDTGVNVSPLSKCLTWQAVMILLYQKVRIYKLGLNMDSQALELQPHLMI